MARVLFVTPLRILIAPPGQPCWRTQSIDHESSAIVGWKNRFFFALFAVSVGDILEATCLLVVTPEFYRSGWNDLRGAGHSGSEGPKGSRY